jgi:FMN phosphatase YigB (HAD superfamily)
MIYGVTFDLWLTLVGELDGGSQSLDRNLLRSELTQKKLLEYNEDISLGTIKKCFKATATKINSQHSLGIDMNYFDRVGQALSLMSPGIINRIGMDAVKDIGILIDSAFLEIPPYVYDDSIPVLKEIKNLGFKIGLISNTGLTSPETYKQWFISENILDYFSAITFSNEKCLAKPAKRIFLETLQVMNVKTNNCMHIGDNLLTDILGANQIGMVTTWISGLDDRDPIVSPDYSISQLSEFPDIVRKWKEKSLI